MSVERPARRVVDRHYHCYAGLVSGASRSEDPFVTATSLWVALHGLVLLRADSPQFPLPDKTQLEDALLGRIALLEPNPT